MSRKHTLITTICLLFFTGCKTQKLNEDVIVIVQPKLEKNTTNSIKILFKDLQLTDSIYIENVEGLELNEYPSKSITELNGNKYLEYYTYVIPTKTGKIPLPTIKGISDSRTIISNPKTVEVFDSLPNVTKNDIVLKLSANKKKFSIKDTISIALYEYSKYYKTNKKTIGNDNDLSIPKIEGKENKIAIKIKSDFYKISGNADLEQYIEDNFNLVDFDWDPFKDNTITEHLNGDLYLKTLIFSLKMTPKQKGKYEIQPSRFSYFVYKSETDFFDDFTPNANGGYTVSQTKNKKIFQSNTLKFEVR